ncbi:glycoside hydrolase superfamily [Gloeopeniophorella convolvens]|nr:glycoside hydrolase superfamily [Gloeopeniophorella convolvens]
MRSLQWFLAALGTLSFTLATPTRTVRWADDAASQFVSVQNGEFAVNGSKFTFIGTNAYWLPYLNSDADINATFANMSASGITVVRTWAFNDVTTIPTAGTWLQLIANGTTQINTGANGLQRLDRLVELANDHGIYVLFSLTNNWNPVATLTPSPTPLPRNFLSNDYGGMDAYVREFGETGSHHDEFYTNMTIRKFFQDYAQAVVTRFANNTRVLAWELANDARCSSSLPSSDDCTTTTVTQWHADVSKFVQSVDPNHIVSSGTQGFFCPSCPKIFFKPPPAPQTSATPGGTRKRAAGSLMTRSKLLKMITDERRRAARSASKRDGVKIRGRWTASLPSAEAKRQSSGVGSAFDGSFGVDSQDILSVPNIGFGSFQLFPDQNSYGTIATQAIQPPSFDFNETLTQGVQWIQSQAEAAQAVGKPLALTGFGLVTQGNLPAFVPFNATFPVAPTPSQNQRRQNANATFGTGITDAQRDDAYATWLQAGIQAGISGMIQYQPVNGTFVQNVGATGTLGVSPNDGYGTLGYVVTSLCAVICERVLTTSGLLVLDKTLSKQFFRPRARTLGKREA